VADTDAWLSAPEASAALGIKAATLYAYVSRALLTRRRRPGSRGSWFDPVEVDRLAARGRGERPGRLREVRIESAVTTIAGGRYFYRGRDPVALARTASFEQVAEFLWTGILPPAPVTWRPARPAVAVGRAVQAALAPDAVLFDRLPLVAAAIAGVDAFRHDLRPEVVVGTARQLIATLVACLPRRRTGVEGDGPLAARLRDRLATHAPTRAHVQAMDGALVLLADHELAASTFAVRIAAALRADPYGVVGAGLGVLGGAWHGAVSVAAEALLREMATRGRVDAVIDARLRRGERLPGLGHPLYPAGDPRAPALLALVRRAGGDARRLRQVEAFLHASAARGLPPPNVDLGLAALAHVLDLVPGAGEVLFAVARMAGWIAHAIEEYARPSTVRPRPVYVGARPGAAGP
jgi:citrate synthase